jgi:hypothetical protein
VGGLAYTAVGDLRRGKASSLNTYLENAAKGAFLGATTAAVFGPALEGAAGAAWWLGNATAGSFGAWVDDMFFKGGNVHPQDLAWGAAGGVIGAGLFKGMTNLAEAVSGERVPVAPEEAKFKYEHNPMDNPKAAVDIIENPDAVYGFSPNPQSESIGGFANKIDWTNSEQVAKATERRQIYHDNNDNIAELVNKMKGEGYSTEDIAKAANNQRNMNRLNDYKNDPVGLECVMSRNTVKYGNPYGPSVELSYNKYGSWEKVIEKSMSANPGMDACCGLYDKYYHLYKFEGN